MTDAVGVSAKRAWCEYGESESMPTQTAKRRLGCEGKKSRLERALKGFPGSDMAERYLNAIHFAKKIKRFITDGDREMIVSSCALQSARDARKSKEVSMLVDFKSHALMVAESRLFSREKNTKSWTLGDMGSPFRISIRLFVSPDSWNPLEVCKRVSTRAALLEKAVGENVMRRRVAQFLTDLDFVKNTYPDTSMMYAFLAEYQAAWKDTWLRLEKVYEMRLYGLIVLDNAFNCNGSSRTCADEVIDRILRDGVVF